MGQSALPLVLERVPATVELGTSGLLIAALVGVSIGILSAIRRDTWIDALGRFLALGSQAMPTFWLGLMLIIIFAVKLRVLPAFGRGEMRHLIMPAVTLATYNIPIILRITRSAFIEVIHQDYIRTARAKGVPENVITFQHILRNAAIPIVTVLGMNFGWMLAGAIAVETVFSWPGIGYFTLQAIFLGDYPVVMASTVILVMGVVIVNFLTDLTYGFLDPRIRYWGKK
jgi:ABC-type dipeptide/oligopeptide/nickel transport system permease component